METVPLDFTGWPRLHIGLSKGPPGTLTCSHAWEPPPQSKIVTPTWQRGYVFCSRSTASKGQSQAPAPELKKGPRAPQSPAVLPRPAFCGRCSLYLGWDQAWGAGAHLVGLYRCASCGQVFPGADEGRGDERVGHGGDAVPRVRGGVIAVQGLTPLGPEVAPHHVELVA